MQKALTVHVIFNGMHMLDQGTWDKTYHSTVRISPKGKRKAKNNGASDAPRPRKGRKASH